MRIFIAILILLTPCLLFAQQSRLEALAETIKASRPLQQQQRIAPQPTIPAISTLCGNPRDPLGVTQLFGVPTSLTAPSIEIIHDATLHDVTFPTPRVGFAVGDHGAIWHTNDGGDHWQLQVTPLDISLRSVQFTDPFCGTVTGYYTLPITGEICSVVLVTNDGGATWKQQNYDGVVDIKNTTPVTLPGIAIPLKKLLMTSDERGTAVGHFGTIVSTSDGGRSWVIQRQGARRLAVLVIVSTKDDLPFELMTKLASEDGYLCGAVVLSQSNPQHAISDAITRSGAISIDANNISTLISSLQPDVVFTTSQLTKLIEESQSQVRKVVLLLPAGVHGETMISASEVLPRLGRSLAEVAWESRAVLGLHNSRLRTSSMIGLQTAPNSLTKTAHPTDPMAGITLLPDSGARRPRIGTERPDIAAEQERLQIHGQLRDALEAYRRSVAEKTAPASIQLVESTVDHFASRLLPTTVTTALWQWGDSLHLRGDWDLAAMALHTLAQRYAAHPLANAATKRLHIYSTSEEAAMRLREKLPENATPAQSQSKTQSKTKTPQDNLPKLIAKRAVQRPYLDGNFSTDSDSETWIHAPLYCFTETPDKGGNTRVMMAYDDEYLYIALRCGCANGAPETTNNTVRPRDADLTQHDRVAITLDVDRCGQLAYTFTVDERGFVHEACGDDASWNPDWYVAHTRDSEAWFIEAALPLAALTRTLPTTGSVWGLGLHRTTPPNHSETWYDDAGLLIFE